MFRRFWEWLHDFLMSWILGTNIIYNCAWEDPRQDQHLLELDENDVVLMITTGGCNVLDRVLDGPKRIITTDLNPLQNAVLELKMACARRLSHEEFFQIWALNGENVLRANYVNKLRGDLSPVAATFWDNNLHLLGNWFYAGGAGLCRRVMVGTMWLCGLGYFMEQLVHCRNIEEQKALRDRYYYRYHFCARAMWATARVFAPLAGVPASQLAMMPDNILLSAMELEINHTHLATDNYFYYAYIASRYTRECCPRYLKAENFDKLRANLDRIEIRTCYLHETIASLPDHSATVAILLDHMDWLGDLLVLEELNLLQKKLDPARGRILYRSAAPVVPHACLNRLEYDDEKVRRVDAQYPCRVGTYSRTFLARFPNDTFANLNTSTFAPPATWASDMKVLYSNVVHKVSGETQEARLASFYSGQADVYDQFRHRFLHGRIPMMTGLPLRAPTRKDPRGVVWVDMGAGTGCNLELVKDSLHLFEHIYLVDLCEPLLAVARARVERLGVAHKVTCVKADATIAADLASLPRGVNGADIVTFSYSLVMIPDWEEALRQATALVRPGGTIACADFTVSHARQMRILRWAWKKFFARDHVHINLAHRERLRSICGNDPSRYYEREDMGNMPYLPIFQAAYYYFIGRPVAASD